MIHQRKIHLIEIITKKNQIKTPAFLQALTLSSSIHQSYIHFIFIFCLCFFLH
ncbi:helix-turn-helix domain-containing protein [Chryseobacterium sp. Leaf405]|uniref:helix-turn-helix domain-containing protein n=1 Tax=Chryseobacterium sp. Leaf405 TaxID=1736367 RepID=UPI000E44EDBE